LLYDLLKIPARLALAVYCPALTIRPREILESKGPLLIACNHPNSFLDAIIIATVFKQPVVSLARGDVFKGKRTIRLLRSMNILPVYRTSEGVENMEENYRTFESCREIFRQNGIVLIFSEGLCINEWHLRPLKKVTARLAISSWDEGIPLRILPAGINYHRFRSFGKIVHLLGGESFGSPAIDQSNGFGKSVLDFNGLLRDHLHPLIYERPKQDRQAQKQAFYDPHMQGNRYLFAIPAALSFLLHAPLYYPVKRFTQKRTIHNDHYDSILVAGLFLGYPLYILFLSCLAFFISHCWISFLLIPVSYMLAWCHARYRIATDVSA
jgi:hypothetical protein